MAALVWISLALGGLAAAAPVGVDSSFTDAPRERGKVGGIVNFCGQIAAISAPHRDGLHRLRDTFLRGGIRYLHCDSFSGDCGLYLLVGAHRGDS